MTTLTDILPAAAPTGDDDATRRAAYIAGLRALAGKLEASPGEVPLPSAGRLEPLAFHFLAGDDPRTAMAAAARAIGGTWDKNVRDYGDAGGSSYFDLTTSIHGLRIIMTAYRDAVCEKVITGTHDVTEVVPDPELLAAVPLIKVTRPVDEVQWVCGPVMAAAAGATAAG
jgi:hypothetical protein